MLDTRCSKVDQKRSSIEKWGEELSVKLDKRSARVKRHRRVRKKVFGTSEQPRLSVYKSIKHIYVQVIDDKNGVTLAAASTLASDVRDKVSGNNIEAAKLVGNEIGKKAVEKNITNVVFDRGGYRYHGKLKALAEAAREAGLKF